MDTPASDLRLVAAARRQEAAAWNVLLKAHQLPLYAYVAELTRDPSVSHDILQETFIAAVKHIGSLREDARFVSWLFGIAHQKCLQHFRRSRREYERFCDEGGLGVDSVDDTSPNARDTLLSAERAAEFFAQLEKLPPVQRSVLLLHVLEDFSLEEIACITAVPVGTVKSRLHHAKRALRELVEERT